jgi:hypothetical protein
VPSDNHDILGAIGSIQAALRKIPQIPVSTLGCRFLHWDPELQKVRSPSKSFPVYWPLDWRSGGPKPKVLFAEIHKAKYAAIAGDGVVERQFGITYSKAFYSRKTLDPLLKAFTECAEQLGALTASAKPLASLFPQATMAVKNNMHRWVFSIFEVAWKNPPESPLSAIKYIPLQGFDSHMKRDESIFYDLDHIRSIPWSQIKLHLDPNQCQVGRFDHFESHYLSWQEKLPEYYASRLNDIVRASDLAIDWVIQRLTRASEAK